jgi:hypothetical protein
MPRAYLRLDPHAFDRKVHGLDEHGERLRGWKPYAPDTWGAFIAVLCLADMQPERGTFRSDRLLRELLRGSDGLGARFARQVPELIARGDLVAKANGRLRVDGWDTWQEGDLTVHERMRRYRAAKRNGTEAEVTEGTVTNVTVDVTADRRARVGRGRSAEAVGGKRLAEAVGGALSRAERSMTDDERTSAVAENRELLGSPDDLIQRAALRALRRLDPDTDWEAERLSILAAPTRTARPRSSAGA